MSGEVLSINATLAKPDIVAAAMGKIVQLFLIGIVTPAIFAVSSTNLAAAKTNAASSPIGVYDSRVVACVWFWSSKHQSQFNALVQSVRAAKAAGDTNHFKQLDAALWRQRKEIHRQVFSIAPSTKAQAKIRVRLPEFQKAAGVSGFASKWDKQTLKQYRHTERVDVTGRLVRALNPNLTEKQFKVISGSIVQATAAKTMQPIDSQTQNLIHQPNL